MKVQITYRDLNSKRYILEKPHKLKLVRGPKEDITTACGRINFRSDGTLTIKEGWHWDGPSGPAMDTKNAMRGSLVHDAFYWMMREKLLDIDDWRDFADYLYRDICKEDGMSRLRAWYQHKGIALFAGGAAEGDGTPEIVIKTAP